MKLSIALVGNPNSGKTSLFNALTGKNNRVGNWAGVSVEKKVGYFNQGENEVELIDLPGIYSLYPHSDDEKIARNFIDSKEADVIINIVDATSLERSLYLTTQLQDLNVPVVIALNMIDELNDKGGSVNFNLLSSRLRCPVIPISATKKINLDDLVVKSIAHSKHKLNTSYWGSPNIEILIKETMHNNNNNRFNALEIITKKYKSDNIEEMIISDRYRYIDIVSKGVLTTNQISKRDILTKKIDDILLNRWLAIPIFLTIMFLIFFVAFNVITPLSEYLLEGGEGSWIGIFGYLREGLQFGLEKINVSERLIRLILEGAVGGVTGVLAFLFPILTVFIFLSLLEDSGYMARAALIFDRVFSKVGLSGKAFISLILGFGCAVPALMSTRTLSSKKERRIALITAPFISCSARLTVFTLFAGALFGSKATLVIFSLYLISIATTLLVSLILSKIILKNEISTFMLELPPYRLPTFNNVITCAKDKAVDFIKRAATIIFLASILIWIFQNISPTLQLVEDPSDSLLAKVSSFISPIMQPVGLNDWRFVAALIVGFIAKELVVATLIILFSVSNGNINDALQSSMSTLTAFSFLTFTLLYVPCLATVVTLKKEFHSRKWTFIAIMVSFVTAYFISLIVYNIGNLLGLGG